MRNIIFFLALTIFVTPKSYSQIDLNEIDLNEFEENKIETFFLNKGIKYDKDKAENYIRYDIVPSDKTVKFNGLTLNNLAFKDLDMSDSSVTFSPYELKDILLVNESDDAPMIRLKYRINYQTAIELHFQTNIINPDSIYSVVRFHDLNRIKNRISNLVKVSIFSYIIRVPPPPPRPPAPKPMGINSSTVDEDLISKLNDAKLYEKAIIYLDSVIFLTPNDFRTNQLMMYFLNKQKKYIETFPFVKKQVDVCEEDEYLPELLEELGELSILTGNQEYWLKLKSKRKELKGNVRYRFLMRFHDFLANTFTNGSVDLKEYDLLLDVCKLIKLYGWGMESIIEHIKASTLEDEVKNKLVALIDEIYAEKSDFISME